MKNLIERCNSNEIFIYLSFPLFKTSEIAQMIGKTPKSIRHIACRLKCKKQSDSYGYIDAAWFNQLKNKAECRGLEFNITREFLNDLLIGQEFKCALSGEEIALCIKTDKTLWKEKNSASLDRINSKEGYTEFNVQFVHKIINMMKYNYSQELFIEMCEKVTEHTKKIKEAN